MLDSHAQAAGIPWVMGMQHAIYTEPFEGSDVEPLTTGMQDSIIQTILPPHYRTLRPILPTLVGRTIQQAAQAVADLGEIELARQKWGIPTDSGEGEEVKFKCKNRR